MYGRIFEIGRIRRSDVRLVDIVRSGGALRRTLGVRVSAAPRPWHSFFLRLAFERIP